MPALQVKDCPTAVYDKLRECAAQENRSISQQALTIIEGYLGMRNVAAPTEQAATAQGPCRPPSAGQECYLERRQRAFDRIAMLRPLPVSKKSPDSADLLRRIREEDAR